MQEEGALRERERAVHGLKRGDSNGWDVKICCEDTG